MEPRADYAQALAFVDACRRGEATTAHLEAALGLGKVAHAQQFEAFHDGDAPAAYAGCAAFVAYLRAVAAALERGPEGDGA